MIVRGLIVPGFIICLLSGCDLSEMIENNRIHIAEITGAAMIMNYSRATHDFGPVQVNDGDTLALTALQGDLLYVLFREIDDVLLYRYDPDDQMPLCFEYDSADQFFSLNLEVISLVLSESSSAWNCIKKQEDKILQNIRSLIITLPLPEGGLESLKRIASVNPDPGLYISGNGKIREIVNIFKPEWFFTEGICYDSIRESGYPGLSRTELVIYHCNGTVDLDILADLPSLQSLVLKDCQSDVLTEIPFVKYDMLQSLCLIESDVKDLSLLAPLENLQDLDLVECKNLQRIETLAEFSKFAGLGFSGCDSILDISVINQLPELDRLCLPGLISQQEFNQILSAQTSLKVLEMLSCKQVRDLTPVSGLSGLRTLTIGTGSLDLSPVYGMQQLELFMLNKEYFEDTSRMTDLRQALPNTRIIPGGAFCLGSGWILLLIPMIIIAVAIRRCRSRS